MNITIIGGSKGVGKALAQQALAAGHHVRVLARSAMTLPAHAKLLWICGDAAKPEDLNHALEGADALAVCLGGHFRKGTTLYSDTVRAMIAAGSGREHLPYLLALSGIGAGDSRGHGGIIYDRLIHPLILRHDYADKNRMERLLQDSDYPHCIIRPGFLTNDDLPDYRVLTNLSAQTRAGKISRRAVAAFMLTEISTQRYKRQIVHCWRD